MFAEDISKLSKTSVKNIWKPKNIEEIVKIVKSSDIVSIKGSGCSMGGHICTENTHVIELASNFNKILNYNVVEKTIEVQSGITWKEIIKYIDKDNLSVSIMQSYANFTVGGSVSVNCHGRYVNKGSVVHSIKSLVIILADGKCVKTSPSEAPNIFFSAIGGYGGIGIIVSVELQLENNVKLKKVQKYIKTEKINENFKEEILGKDNFIFYNADMYFPYDKTLVTTYETTDEALTNDKRYNENVGDIKKIVYGLSFYLMSEWSGYFRHIINYYVKLTENNTVCWRNFEASYDIEELEPNSREKSTYVLQEYFIPMDKTNEFYKKATEILVRHKVKTINISIRHSIKDDKTMLSWAGEDCYSFVHYYKQGTSEEDKEKVGVWTRELINEATEIGGSYYLPYQLHASREQFLKVYKRAEDFFAIKQSLDPNYKFRNKFFDKYYLNLFQTGNRSVGLFEKIVGNVENCDKAFLFCQNVFSIYDPVMIIIKLKQLVKKYGSEDKKIYNELQNDLPNNAFQLWKTYKSLQKQKKVLSSQTKELVQGTLAGEYGYLECGTNGRYISSIIESTNIQGPYYYINDTPNGKFRNMIETGSIVNPGICIDDNCLYRFIKNNEIKNNSLGLVTLFIGAHHGDSNGRHELLKSVYRVLKPGGSFIIREHDVVDKESEDMVKFAHIIYNCGTGITWKDNKKEMKNTKWTNVASLVKEMEDLGFTFYDKSFSQHKDPSNNKLLRFIKPYTIETLRIRHTRSSKLYYTLPEWYIVHVAKEMSEIKIQKFSFSKAIEQYSDLHKYAIKNSSGDSIGQQMSYFDITFVGICFIIEMTLSMLYENSIGKILNYTTCSEDREIQNYLKRYSDFLNHTPWFKYDYISEIKCFFENIESLTNEGWSKIPHKLERRIRFVLEMLFKQLYSYCINKCVGIEYDKDDRMTKTLVEYEDGTHELIKRYSGLKNLSSDKNIISIAGQTDFITCSLLTVDKKLFKEYDIIHENDSLSCSTIKRLYIKLPIYKVTKFIKDHRQHIENIYDY